MTMTKNLQLTLILSLLFFILNTPQTYDFVHELVHNVPGMEMLIKDGSEIMTSGVFVHTLVFALLVKFLVLPNA